MLCAKCPIKPPDPKRMCSANDCIRSLKMIVEQAKPPAEQGELHKAASTEASDAPE